MTREEWLRHAVEQIDTFIFHGDLNLLEHDFQISSSKCGGTKYIEVFQPYQGENVNLDDFFPTTICVNHQIKDVEEMLIQLTLGCMTAFLDMKPNSKKFKKAAEGYGFDTNCAVSGFIKDNIRTIYDKLKKNYGDFPGKPVVIHKEKKEPKKNSFTVFCPECGFEMKVSKKMFDKHGKACPTCPCGVKMGIDYDDAETEKE